MNEAFDLNTLFKTNNIHPLIQLKAKEIITKWIGNIDKTPFDVDINKLIFWFAKNLNKGVITYITSRLNYYYDIIQETPNDNSNNKYEIFKTLLYNIKNNNDLTSETHILDDIIKSIKSHLNDNIRDYLLSNVRNPQVWKINYMSTIEELDKTAKEWHDKLKASGSITHEEGKKLISYNDGFYWIDLKTNSSKEEANAMGHCGRTNSDTILSLRQKNKFGDITPFVTIAIDYKNDDDYGEISQCKGKNNKKPIDKYHKYIVDLYTKYKIGIDNTCDSEEDFDINDIKDENLLDKILNDFPELLTENILFYKNENITKKLINANKLDINKIDKISNNFYLYKKGIISIEDFANKYNDVVTIHDNGLYFKYDGSIEDLSHMYSDSNNRNRYSSRYIVENMDDIISNEVTYYSFEDCSTSLLTDRAETAIREAIAKTLMNSDEEVEDEDEYSSWIDQIENMDCLSDIKSNIELAFSNAQEQANYKALFKAIYNPFLTYFGMNKIIRKDGNMLIKIVKENLINYDLYSDESKLEVDKILEYCVGEIDYIELGELFDIDTSSLDGYIDEDILEEEILKLI